MAPVFTKLCKHTERTFIYLFIYLYFSLHNSTVSNMECAALVIVMMNWATCGRKQLWPNIRYSAGICQERLRKHSGFFVSQAIFYPVTNTNYKYYPLSQLALYIVDQLLCKTIRGSYKDGKILVNSNIIFVLKKALPLKERDPKILHHQVGGRLDCVVCDCLD